MLRDLLLALSEMVENVVSFINNAQKPKTMYDLLLHKKSGQLSPVKLSVMNGYCYALGKYDKETYDKKNDVLVKYFKYIPWSKDEKTNKSEELK